MSQQGDRKEFDALVIGTGLAGLCFCLELTKHKPDINIALITKAELSECNSRYAQGGIAAVSLQSDSFAKHVVDTLKAGDGLCIRDNVESIITEGPEAIQGLLEAGVDFDKNGDEYSLAKEGGHQERRIYHCGDKTGHNVMAALVKKILALQNIQLFSHHTAINLIKQNPTHTICDQGEVHGAYILDEKANQIHTFLANITILATGGSGKTFRYTTNPEVATGDGLAMAYRAGARVGNMEFFQFHPTLLYHQTINNFLISEAVRGEGAKLLNGDTLERFMPKYAPKLKELATRDVVARAIFTEIEKSKASFVYLDVTHHDKAFLQKRFPQIFQTLTDIGIDMSQDYIPVVPAAHYQCGGVLTNAQGETDLGRLYAIGEVAFTGLHGANRLASNSLLEAIVLANKAAQCALQLVDKPLKNTELVRNWHSGAEINLRRASQINAHWRGLRGEMTSYAGIVRTKAGLYDLLRLIRTRKKIIEEYYWHHQVTRDFIELRNIILIAELIVSSALRRNESRGGHYREDYPDKNDNVQESIYNSGYMSIRRGEMNV